VTNNAKIFRAALTAGGVYGYAGTCNLCTAQGKTRVHKTESGRQSHLTEYHRRCKGCQFKHEQHVGPCGECACGHAVTESPQ